MNSLAKDFGCDARVWRFRHSLTITAIIALALGVGAMMVTPGKIVVASGKRKQDSVGGRATVSTAAKELRATTLYQPAWSPDNRFITFDAKIGEKWAIMKIGADGTDLQTLTEPTLNSRSSSWSPDGKRIVFLSDRGGRWDVYAMDADGANITQLTKDEAREWSPRWSPDGRSIAFLSDRDGRKEIYVMRPDGAEPFRVTRELADIDGRLCWTPDGKIAFYATLLGKRTADENPSLLWLARLDGSGLIKLTRQPRREWNPTWSPDGQQMAFDAHQRGQWESADGGWEVWAQNADGAKRRRLTRNSVNDWGPAWSPDGTRIAYCSGMNDKYEIWTMKANGADARRLTHLVYGGPAPGERRSQADKQRSATTRPKRPAESTTPQSNEGALRALDAALRALGGLERLQAITSLTIKAKGKENRSAEIQGYRPEAPTSGNHEETLAIFPAAGKLALDHRTDRHDGSVRHRRWLFAGDDRTVADFIIQDVFPRRNVSTETERARLARRVPHLLLLEAARHPASLRLLSNATAYEGRNHQTLSWSPPNEKVRFRLFFDARTHLLSKCEYTLDYPGLGDTVIEYVYSGWRRRPQLGWFPANQAIKIGGKTFRRVNNLEVEVNAPQAEDIFRLPELKRPQPAEVFRSPEGFNVAEANRGKVIEVAKGVYMTLIGSFNVMFVEFKDFVLAVEAPANALNTDYLPADNQPGSATLSENYIRKIKETVPNKPIRYLAITHFHNDHAGGARAFLAEGATIVTTPGDKAFYERMAAAKFEAVPDRFSQARRAARIETFAHKRVITDGARTVELLNTGANPHTAENIVVYLPREKILYQGDLFYFDIGAEFPPKDRIIVMRPFAEWLKKNKLSPEQIYQTHEVGFATPKHITRILEPEGN